MPERASARFRIACFAIAAAVAGLDQWTKQLAEGALDRARPVELLPVLDLNLHYNTGAAFSILSQAGGWQRWFLSALALIVSAIIALWLCRLGRSERLTGLGLAFILGGALGNLWDRIALGYVVDFISAHWGGAYFPAFNVADAAITTGAVLLIIDTARSYKSPTGAAGKGDGR